MLIAENYVEDTNPSNYLDNVGFLQSREPRCACILLLDTSKSMKGEPITKLNEGFKHLVNTLKDDQLAALRVELSVITFGGKVLVVEEFSTVDQISCTAFVPKGNTPMGEAIEHAVALLTERKNMYKASGLPYYRPWIFLVTDGEPTDDWQTAATLVHEQEAGKHLLFFAVGVGHANMSVLKQISVRQPAHLNELEFADMFEWLSDSLSGVSSSDPGGAVELKSIESWGVISS